MALEGDSSCLLSCHYAGFWALLHFFLTELGSAATWAMSRAASPAPDPGNDEMEVPFLRNSVICYTGSNRVIGLSVFELRCSGPWRTLEAERKGFWPR